MAGAAWKIGWPMLFNSLVTPSKESSQQLEYMASDAKFQPMAKRICQSLSILTSNCVQIRRGMWPPGLTVNQGIAPTWSELKRSCAEFQRSLVSPHGRASR
jgi:hypothetical protein